MEERDDLPRGRAPRLGGHVARHHRERERGGQDGDDEDDYDDDDFDCEDFQEDRIEVYDDYGELVGVYTEREYNSMRSGNGNR